MTSRGPSVTYYAAGATVWTLATLLLAAHAGPATPAPSGDSVYKQRCAVCHGARGEGSKLYHKPLTGSQTATQLAAFIAQNMPPGPRKCPRADARAVAAYIYDAFYSPIAQARNRPARIELARLTVRQYRNAVADLIGSFRDGGQPDDRRGLRAEYYKRGGFDGGNRVLERVDPEVRFDFGTKGALPADDDPYQFAMRWEGSLLPDDTGEYEIVVRSPQAVRLWVNDVRKPLIDASVKSGSTDEYRTVVYMLGGRAYPMRLEFQKGITGVDDVSKLKKKPPEKAAIELDWKPPRRPEEPIPQRCLSPMMLPEVYSVSTAFPPDDRSMGYERGTSISKEWEDSTVEAALDTAAYVVAHLRELSGVPDNAPDRAAKLRDFCHRFVDRAFRRPLAPDVEQLYVDREFARTPDPQIAVKRVVLLALSSPRFLYREVASRQPDAYTIASRLSFGLWDSLPDRALLSAAAAGQLSTPAQVRQQAERMVVDPRAWSKVRQFLLQWLKVDQAPDLAKDPHKFPDFDQATAADLRTSLELFLRDVAWGDSADYRDLMQSDKVYLDGRVAKLYGANLPADAPFQPVDQPDRCGVLTQPYILATFAYVDSSSPIHRGVLIVRNMLGRVLNPPPAAFAPTPASLHPDMTTRQRVSMQTKPTMCQGCHGIINPLGFTLEGYDAIGRARTTENGKPVDTTGAYRCAAGTLVQFSGERDLARYLADSDDAHHAFVEKLFQFAIQQPIRAYGPQTLPTLEHDFAADQYSIKKLLAAAVSVAALHGTPMAAQRAATSGRVAAAAVSAKAGQMVK